MNKWEREFEIAELIAESEEQQRFDEFYEKIPNVITSHKTQESHRAVPAIQREVMHMFVWCCGSCGVTITDGDKFCRMCGKPILWEKAVK